MALSVASSECKSTHTHKAMLLTPKNARMRPRLSLFYCVLWPKKKTAISISGDWAKCGSRGDSSTITTGNMAHRTPIEGLLLAPSTAAYGEYSNGEEAVRTRTPADARCKFSGPEVLDFFKGLSFFVLVTLRLYLLQ
ncbi:hypothetical protein GWK47_029396 [Chionoecetes opilio]|uniref:Uncharacterized protein n=1 Tax=Chionoecetes opilio TaxID=41210 RepID=A0A8J4YLH8_CHIOP|nr:hypothetical protein GWK47_029396 [Chionoecetes opilio]